MLLSEMEAELYDHFGYGESPAPAVVTRFRRNLNTAYKEILSKKGMAPLRRGVLTFASIANTPYAVLPQAATRLISVHDRTGSIPLDRLMLSDIRRDDPGATTTSGNPNGYVIDNLAASVARDPTAAAELFVKSSSAADGTGLTATVSGIITGGYQRTVSIPMSGLTAVSLDITTTTWIAITRFNLSGVAQGNVTLHMTSGLGTELARITIGRSSARYTRLILHPIPSAVVTYHADVELAVDGLAAPNDETLLPEDFAWLLPCGAMMREYQKRQHMEEYANERSRWKSGVGDLRLHLQRQTAGSADGRHRHSQLGPYYQPGS